MFPRQSLPMLKIGENSIADAGSIVGPGGRPSVVTLVSEEVVVGCGSGGARVSECVRLILCSSEGTSSTVVMIGFATWCE